MGCTRRYPYLGFSTHQILGRKYSTISMNLQTRKFALSNSLGAVVLAREYSAQDTLAAIILKNPGGYWE